MNVEEMVLKTKRAFSDLVSNQKLTDDAISSLPGGPLKTKMKKQKGRARMNFCQNVMPKMKLLNSYNTSSGIISPYVKGNVEQAAQQALIAIKGNTAQEKAVYTSQDVQNINEIKKTNPINKPLVTLTGVAIAFALFGG